MATMRSELCLVVEIMETILTPGVATLGVSCGLMVDATVSRICGYMKMVHLNQMFSDVGIAKHSWSWAGRDGSIA